MLRSHIQTLSLVLGLYNIDLITLWLHESHCQAIDIKEALVGRQPNFIYLILFYFVLVLFLCLIRYMIMRSHEKNIKIKNRIKNSRRKITPWRKDRLAFNASKEHLAGVQRQNRA